MKKLISFVLSLTMVLSSFPLVFADDGEQVEKLILSVKERFAIDDNLFVFDEYSKDEYYGETSYYLMWKSKEEGQYSHTPYISVNISDDGEINSYAISRSKPVDTFVPKFTDDEIAQKAKEYVAKIAPERSLKLAEPVVRNDFGTSVSFERLENNIPVARDQITVTLDPDDLSLINYRAQWSKALFPSADGVISFEDARNHYAENLGYEPLYNVITRNNDVEKIYISYDCRDSSALIDAFTGDAVKHRSNVFKESASGAIHNQSADLEESGEYLSPEEQALIEEINKMITKDDAEKIARSFKELNIPDNASVSSYSVAKNAYGSYISSISFAFDDEEKEKYYHGRVSIDAHTKELLHFYSYYDYDPSAKPCAPEKAEKTAMDFINKYYSEKSALCKPTFSIEGKSDYVFSFDRYENGVRVKNQGLKITINEITGQISSFACNWADLQFPGKENIVAPSFIYKDVLDTDNFRLQYVTTSIYAFDEKTESESKKEEAYLVYAVQEAPLFDALSGRKIDSRGDFIKEEFSGYSDLNGHYSENAASELARADIYFEGGKLEPDKQITQIEYLRLLHRALYSGYFTNDDDIYADLISAGILTEDEVGKPLTRSDAIRYFIDILGYGDAAKIEGIYNCPFEDVAPEIVGYVSIAGGLKIISTATKTFRPDDIMTRGETVTVLYNHLKR